MNKEMLSRAFNSGIPIGPEFIGGSIGVAMGVQMSVNLIRQGPEFLIRTAMEEAAIGNPFGVLMQATAEAGIAPQVVIGAILVLSALLIVDAARRFDLPNRLKFSNK